MTPPNAERPKCKCHDVPMLWQKFPSKPSGGWWYCRIKSQERYKKYYAATQTRQLERVKQYAASHLDQKRAYNKAWREKNRERWLEGNRERAKRWNERHPEGRKALNESWRERNPEAVDVIRARRRARKANAEHEPWTRQQVWERGKGICHICGVGLPSKSWTVDHVIPLARGGADKLANLLPAHRACNSRKGAREQPRVAS